MKHEKPRVIPDEVFETLVRDGLAMFDRLTGGPDETFPNLILADPHGALEALSDLRSRGRSFLELGSGIGIITIIADLLGYDAYGIEIEPRLVDDAYRLAESCGSKATFIEGSFVPPEIQEDVALLSATHFTCTSGADAYAEMGMTMRDFDLVYAYPWPDETEWLYDLFRRAAQPASALLSYSVRDGFILTEADAEGTLAE